MTDEDTSPYADKYKDWIFFPDMIDSLPGALEDGTYEELKYVAYHCPPMNFSFNKQLDEIAAYLCNPRVVTAGIKVPPTYLPGTNINTEFNRLQQRIANAPYFALKQMLMQSTNRRTPQTTATISAILRNWHDGGGLLFGYPQKSVEQIRAMMFDDCCREQGLSLYFNRLSFIETALTVGSAAITFAPMMGQEDKARAQEYAGWMGDLLEQIPELTSDTNNILQSNYLCRMMLAALRGAPLLPIAMAHNDYLSSDVLLSPDGYLTEECKRQNMAICYHHRFMIVCLWLQCLLYRLGLPTASPRVQKKLALVLDNMDTCCKAKHPSGQVLPPTGFHAHSAPPWEGSMTACEGTGDLRAMYDYAFCPEHDPQRVGRISYMWGVNVYGQLTTTLRALATFGAAPASPGPSAFAMDHSVSETGATVDLAPEGPTPAAAPRTESGSQPLQFELLEVPPGIRAAIEGSALTWAPEPPGSAVPCGTRITIAVTDAVGGRAVACLPVETPARMLTLRLYHPDGRCWKFDSNGDIIRLNRGSEIDLEPDHNDKVYCHDKGRIALRHAGNKKAVRHSACTLRCNDFQANNFDFAWHFRKAPGGDGKSVHVFNDYGGDNWVGYDAAKDEVVIVPGKDKRKVAWRLEGLLPPTVKLHQ